MDSPDQWQRITEEFDRFREYLPGALLEIDFQSRAVTFMNRMGKILSGFDPDKPVTDIQAADLFACIEEYERAVEMTRNYVLESIQNGVPYKRTGDQELVEFRMKKRDGHTFPAESQGSLVLDARGIPYAVRIVLRDISKRKQLEEERENLVRDLEEALEHVKTLQGLIPICSSCKKIRDDDGSWNLLELYIEEHSDAKFSHGICPDCMKKLYPDISGSSE